MATIRTDVGGFNMCALARRVLVVAHGRVEGTWCAYIDAVPGQNHEREAGAVLEQGVKVPEGLARMLFPRYADIPYAR